MKIYKYLLILILLLFSINAYSQDWTEIDLYLYYGYTGKDITIEWSDPGLNTPSDTTDDYDPLTDKFEVSIYNKERDITIIKHSAVPGDVFEYTFSLPKTGHWVPRVRAIRNEGEEISGWSGSDNKGYVNEVARGWWLFGWIAPTGPIEP